MPPVRHFRPALIALALSGTVVSAAFAQTTYKLTVGKAENIVVRGGADGKPQTIDCGGWAASTTCVASYPAGTTVKLSAGATTVGMVWNNWVDACQSFGSQPQCTIVMTRNMQVWGSAKSVGTTHVKVATPSNGYIYGTSPATGDRWVINCGNNGPCDVTLTRGDKLTLKVKAHDRYVPGDWFGECATSRGDTCTITAYLPDMGLSHTFKVETHPLTIQLGANVTTRIENQPTPWSCGGPQTCVHQVVGYSINVRIRPDDGYVIASKTGCAMVAGNDGDLCVVNIFGNDTKVSFTAKKR